MQPIVETRYGKVRGMEEGSVHVFRGIPYARPPVEARRFLAPQPPEPWVGVLEAEQFGPAAPQNASLLGPLLAVDAGAASEDCLSLNVWTPNVDGGPFPVMVWIHGGAFVMGASAQKFYRGDTLARRGGVVVVTINYRLGALGYLHLREVIGEGQPVDENLGLRDQIAALEWVRDNIAAFGGDPRQVTIFGESAGSISVATLLGTPSARGLFGAAILQSGSANFNASRQQSNAVAERFVTEAGLDARHAAQILRLPTAQLLDAQTKVAMAMAGSLAGLPFQPVVDGDVLPKPAFQALRDGLNSAVRVLVGTNLDEMKLFGFMDPEARQLDDERLLRRCERRLPRGSETAAHVIDVYRRARRERGDDVSAPEVWCAIDSDRMFRHPAMHLAELQSAHCADVYSYLFTWKSPLMDGQLGACHALEIPFVFGTHEDPMISMFTGSGRAADALATTMQDAWIHFAHTGRPAAAGLETWRAYEREQRNTMVLGPQCFVESAPREAERSVWDRISGPAA